jgi:hypothetical protein
MNDNLSTNLKLLLDQLYSEIYMVLIFNLIKFTEKQLNYYEHLYMLGLLTLIRNEIIQENKVYIN